MNSVVVLHNEYYKSARWNFVNKNKDCHLCECHANMGMSLQKQDISKNGLPHQ